MSSSYFVDSKDPFIHLFVCLFWLSLSLSGIVYVQYPNKQNQISLPSFLIPFKIKCLSRRWFFCFFFFSLSKLVWGLVCCQFWLKKIRMLHWFICDKKNKRIAPKVFFLSYWLLLDAIAKHPYFEKQNLICFSI